MSSILSQCSTIHHNSLLTNIHSSLTIIHCHITKFYSDLLVFNSHIPSNNGPLYFHNDPVFPHKIYYSIIFVSCPIATIYSSITNISPIKMFHFLILYQPVCFPFIMIHLPELFTIPCQSFTVS